MEFFVWLNVNYAKLILKFWTVNILKSYLRRNLTMLADFYEFTMVNGYFKSGLANSEVVFDMFFRKIPDNGGFAIFAGLEQLVQYITELNFTEEDILYLKSRGSFSEEFINYLINFKFTADVWSVPEGTPVFPNEPIITVKGPLIQAQFIETMLLLSVNYQTMVATKASRMVNAAKGRPVVEFGSRRAQSYDAAILGARAAYIAGCAGTACTASDLEFSIPIYGTMAHSWVQVFDSEYEAFKAYAMAYPEKCSLLVDTYNCLRSGIPNAIRVFDEVLKPRGIRPLSVRIDSGDLAYLSKRARHMLDEAGYSDVKIMASNSLDEYLIRDLLQQGAEIDIFGVGENLITSKSDPVFGGVYKLVAVKDENGELKSKIKISESAEKITTPGHKKIYRIFRKNGDALADYLTLFDEVPPEGELELFDPNAVWKRLNVKEYIAKELHVKVFENGKLVYNMPTLDEIRENCKNSLATLWEESKRFENPHGYYVDHSQKLYDLRQQLLIDAGKAVARDIDMEKK